MGPLSLEEVSQLLWAASGRNLYRRTAPSAGVRSSITTHILSVMQCESDTEKAWYLEKTQPKLEPRFIVQIDNQDLITPKPVLAGYRHTPEFLESFLGVVEPEGLGTSPIQGSAIPCVVCYAYVHRRNQRAFPHCPYPSRSHPVHRSLLLVCGRNKQLQKGRISLFLVLLNHELQYSKL